MIRNFLCIKNKNTLSNADKLLYNPYKNIIINFFELATNKSAAEFDPISRAFSGIDNVDKDIKNYYEAMLGITSYYQASKGGRGKYIEKRFASITEFCGLGIQIKKIPLWLENPLLVRNKSLFGETVLTREEKSKLRLSKWSWIGNDKEDNVTTDLGNIFKGSVLYMELKNRIDSGGTAARREVWDTKFKKIINLISSGKKIFKNNSNRYNFLEIYNYFKINRVKLNLGILFNVDGLPATKEMDKTGGGFFSTNRDLCRSLKSYVENSTNFEVVNFNTDELKLNLKLRGINFYVDIATIYGNDIPQILLDRKLPLTDLLFSKFDDIWLSQLLAIDERANLLKFNDNALLEIKNVLERKHNTRKTFDTFIMSGGKRGLKKLLTILKNEINNKFIPERRNKKDYLNDLLYFYGGRES